MSSIKQVLPTEKEKRSTDDLFVLLFTRLALHGIVCYTFWLYCRAVIKPATVFDPHHVVHLLFFMYSIKFSTVRANIPTVTIIMANNFQPFKEAVIKSDNHGAFILSVFSVYGFLIVLQKCKAILV